MLREGRSRQFCLVKTLTVKCPICHKMGEWKGNPYRPFCSRRCRLVDLNGWLEERYRIPDDDVEESGQSDRLSPDEELREKFS
jgi:uncharacterized protein